MGTAMKKSLFGTKDHIWSATHLRHSNSTWSYELALFNSWWIYFAENLLLDRAFEHALIGQCSPFNYSLANMGTNMPIMSILQTLVSCALTNQHTCKGKRWFKANFKIIVIIYIKMLKYWKAKTKKFYMETNTSVQWFSSYITLPWKTKDGHSKTT